MKKSFELPKEFAEKWVAALRSGDYLQGEEYLAIETRTDDNECRYCCLGVAGIVCGMSLAELQDNQLLNDLVHTPGFDKLPRPLVLYNNSHPLEVKPEHTDPKNYGLVEILTYLNDGIFTIIIYNNIMKQYPNIIFRKTVNNGSVKYSFEEIADFIEDNCEFV